MEVKNRGVIGVGVIGGRTGAASPEGRQRKWLVGQLVSQCRRCQGPGNQLALSAEAFDGSVLGPPDGDDVSADKVGDLGHRQLAHQAQHQDLALTERQVPDRGDGVVDPS